MAASPRFSVPRALGFLTLAAALVATPLAEAAPRAGQPLRAPRPNRANAFDLERRADAGRINMFTTNYGTIAWDQTSGGAGLVWPRGSGLTAVFASGLWLGCTVNGEVRTVVAEYSSEYGPGPMQGGTFVDPSLPEHKTYKVSRWTGDPSDTAHVDRTPAELAADPQLDPLAHHSWSEYIAGARPYGAPTRMWRLPNTTTPQPDDSVDVEGPDVLADQMLWSVYNDADPAHHQNNAGASTPLGVEIQQSVFTFARSDDVGDIVFVRFRITNRGTNTLDDLHVSVWSDPDLGGSSDDLVGCDTTRTLGYCYNAYGSDALYGSPPPAVGYVLLRGATRLVDGADLGLTAFNKYINGTDPSSPLETWNYMQGRHADGSLVIDPTTNMPTRYFHPGNPEAASGWLDSNPSDRRMLLSSGPSRMLPGEVQEVWAAIVVGAGATHIASVSTVRCLADIASTIYHSAFTNLLPEPWTACGTSPPPANCPKPAAFWAYDCPPGQGLLSDPQLDQVAAWVSDHSTLFDWPVNPRPQFCATVGPPGPHDLRSMARSEFAAFLANMSGNEIDLPIGGGNRIRLHPLTSIECPPLRARTLGELAAPASTNVGFLDGVYWNDVMTNRRALEGVNAGLPGFGGGASTMYDFFGSSIDPFSMPDSFMTVELRFDHTTTQKAYRYLRIEEQGTGAAPAGGREYRYAGFHTVPFTCWDVVNNVQLDVGFVERAVTDAGGTILPPVSQVATFDSTWAPDSSALGGREYLFVFSRPYSPAPKAELAQDGLPFSGVSPGLYALWSKLRADGDVIDDGDRFQFVWGVAPTPGADSLMVALESQSLADPAVQLAYQNLIDCLSNINHGVGIGPTCDFVVPTLVSLVSADVVERRVRLVWHGPEVGWSAAIERRDEGGDWVELARLSSDATGRLAYVDADVVAGGRYEYRLAIAGPDGIEYLGATEVSVPVSATLAFLGARRDDAGGGMVITYSLATREAARLELIDVAGRRVRAIDLGAPGAGTRRHLLDDRPLPAGIYLVRIVQGTGRVNGKIAVVR